MISHQLFGAVDMYGKGRYWVKIETGCNAAKTTTTTLQKARLPIYGASVWAKAALLQVLVRLRQPDDAGRTNVQVCARCA